jgi:glyoxylase-like metal-dependent hydrolase (beta-lactamase superfamily II)
MNAQPQIQAFFDEATNTVTYLVADPATGRAAVIDPVLDYDHRSGRAAVTSAERILEVAAQQGLHIEWILETHAHADHLSAATYLRSRTGADIRRLMAHTDERATKIYLEGGTSALSDDDFVVVSAPFTRSELLR